MLTKGDESLPTLQLFDPLLGDWCPNCTHKQLLCWWSVHIQTLWIIENVLHTIFNYSHPASWDRGIPICWVCLFLCCRANDNDDYSCYHQGFNLGNLDVSQNLIQNEETGMNDDQWALVYFPTVKTLNSFPLSFIIDLNVNKAQFLLRRRRIARIDQCWSCAQFRTQKGRTYALHGIILKLPQSDSL